MINKIKNDLIKLKGKEIRFRYNGTRNQIEEFDGIIKECYDYVFIIDLGYMNRSFSYSDILIGALEVNIW